MAEQVLNPFDSANFTSGGGLWDGKTVTITAAKAKFSPMQRGDGTPVIDETTNEPIVKRVVEIRGIADGEEAERYEQYSIGSLVPTQDGEGFTKQDGTIVPVHKSAEAAQFFDGVKNGGFDVNLLWDGKTQKLSALVGARFVMKGVDKLDKDGNVKKSKKGYDQQRFVPVKFVGFSNTVKSQSAGNGVSGNGASALKDKATEVVLTILSEAEGNTVTRAELVRELGRRLAGDGDSSKIIALTTREDFHKGQVWKRDGASYSL